MVGLAAGDEARTRGLAELKEVLPRELYRGFHGFGAWGVWSVGLEFFGKGEEGDVLGEGREIGVPELTMKARAMTPLVESMRSLARFSAPELLKKREWQ